MKHCFVSILRNASGDCTNYGLSSRIEHTGLFSDCTEQEAIAYCKEHGWNPEEMLIMDLCRYPAGREYLRSYPLVKKEGLIGPMFGGNYCTTSGSDLNYPKFTGLKVNVPIPIHDRYETQEEYDILFR